MSFDQANDKDETPSTGDSVQLTDDNVQLTDDVKASVDKDDSVMYDRIKGIYEYTETHYVLSEDRTEVLGRCMVPTVHIKKLTPTAKLPKRASGGSAGYDVYSDVSGVLKYGERALISTGFAMAFDPNHYCRIAPRSGLSWKHGIDTGAGVIDSDYRDKVMILLINNDHIKKRDFEYNVGDRIAQFVFEKISLPIMREVKELDETVRQGGFGSTGTR